MERRDYSKSLDDQLSEVMVWDGPSKFDAAGNPYLIGLSFLATLNMNCPIPRDEHEVVIGLSTGQSLSIDPHAKGPVQTALVALAVAVAAACPAGV